jgi:hypothetical protein
MALNAPCIFSHRQRIVLNSKTISVTIPVNFESGLAYGHDIGFKNCVFKF